MRRFDELVTPHAVFSALFGILQNPRALSSEHWASGHLAPQIITAYATNHKLVNSIAHHSKILGISSPRLHAHRRRTVQMNRTSTLATKNAKHNFQFTMAATTIGCLLAGGAQTSCALQADGQDPSEIATSSRSELYGFTPNITPWANGLVSICTINDVDKSTVNGIMWRLRDTWGTAANVSFLYQGACTGGYIPNRIEMSVANNVPNPGGNCPVGSTWEGPCELGFGSYNDWLAVTSPSASTVANRSYIGPRHTTIHEFGHALGFWHEQDREDNYGTNGNPIWCTKGAAPIVGGTNYTSWDFDSIMNYCACERDTGPYGSCGLHPQNLSAKDKAGVASVYGAPPLRPSRNRAVFWKESAGLIPTLHEWLMPSSVADLSLTTPTSIPVAKDVLGSPWRATHTGDFDGDGMADLLWRNSSDGTISIWYLNAGSSTRETFPQSTGITGYVIEGTGDFNADGKSDILWRETATGRVAIWPAAVPPGYSPGYAPSNWSFQSTGDFNGDGRADILWRNTLGELSVWYSGESAQAVLLSGNRHPDVYKLAATADFDGDGKSDLIWQYLHGQRGVSIWPSANVSNALSLGDLPLPWEILGAGDFDGNGDSNSDLLLRNGSSQILVVWRSAHPWESIAMGASAGNMKYFGTARDLAN